MHWFCLSLLVKKKMQEEMGFPQWLSSTEATCKAGATGDAGSIPGLERSPGGGHGNPLQCSCLESPMDRGAWRATVHGVAKELDVTEQVITGGRFIWGMQAVYFSSGSEGKESACNAGDQALIPGLGRSPGGGHGNPLHYSCLESPHGQRA